MRSNGAGVTGRSVVRGAPTSYAAAMLRLQLDHIEVYVFRRRARRVQFLALKRAERGRLSGVWQPVTGSLHPGESAFAGARREVREETGCDPRRWWRLESPAIFFDPRRDRVQIVPRFAAEIRVRDVIRISREHQAHAFLDARRAGARFLWDSQREGLALVRAQILRGGPLADALEIDAAATARRTSRRRRR
jgi:8-oxo-dGTP pyrophosphatase MutT (NUDIX family)